MIRACTIGLWCGVLLGGAGCTFAPGGEASSKGAEAVVEADAQFVLLESEQGLPKLRRRIGRAYHRAIADALRVPFRSSLYGKDGGVRTIAFDFTAVEEVDYPGFRMGDDVVALDDALAQGISLLEGDRARVNLELEVRDEVATDGSGAVVRVGVLALGVVDRDTGEEVWSQSHVLAANGSPRVGAEEYSSTCYLPVRVREIRDAVSPLLAQSKGQTEKDWAGAAVLDWQSLVLSFWGLPLDVLEKSSLTRGLVRAFKTAVHAALFKTGFTLVPGDFMGNQVPVPPRAILNGVVFVPMAVTSVALGTSKLFDRSKILSNSVVPYYLEHVVGGPGQESP